MALWEEHKSRVLIPALAFVSWASIRSYSAPLCLDSFACGREITHVTSPRTCARGGRNPHSPAFQTPWPPHASF